jgi:glycosyltransferase involved in cell wall biosynthesis
MQLIGLCVTRNEADIIGFSLRHASRFCDAIYVLDNGSTDGTWEIVRRIARENSAIVPFERKECVFARGLRAYVHDKVRARYSEKDWFMFLDSDEFLEEDPKPLLSWCNERSYDHVFALQAHFYIVQEDLDKGWFHGNGPIQSFEELPQHYRINNREPRFFRNGHVDWPIYNPDQTFANIHFPTIGRACPRMVVNRHYQYRSKRQIEERIEQRAFVSSATGCFQHHRGKRGLDTYVKDKRRLSHGRGQVIKSSSRDVLLISWYKFKKKIGRTTRRTVERLAP